MPPRAETVALVEYELVQARTWADRRNVPLDWSAEGLRLRTVMTQSDTGQQFHLQGRFEDYKELPPEWEFFDSTWSASGEKCHYPARQPCPFGSTIFHPDPFVCVPFNRLAYEEVGGRHGDWGGPENWRNVEVGYAHATQIGRMLQHIHRHLSASRGRMA